VWTRATEVRLETGKGNPMCPRNLHFWKLPKSELQAQLQREIKVGGRTGAGLPGWLARHAASGRDVHTRRCIREGRAHTPLHQGGTCTHAAACVAAAAHALSHVQACRCRGLCNPPVCTPLLRLR
jgi:hypothetical protein